MRTSIQFTRSRRRPQAEEGPLRVIYEDEWLMAVDKPAGLVVHPTYKNPSGTLLNAVLWRVRERPEAQPGILNRLDRDTSGLVMIALTPQVHATFQRDAATGLVAKEYVAVVRGTPTPQSGRILLPLSRDAGDRRRVVASPDGARCETRYEVLSQADDRALLLCRLVTGRTHQIRVHLAVSGWPVLGDRTYAALDASISRQALHAWRMSLPHPVSRTPLRFSAPLPEDMSALGFPDPTAP